MKRCVIDGARVRNAAAVYQKLDRVFGFPDYFGGNPDALWDALGDYAGEDVTIVWRNSARSAATLGRSFAEIVAVLERAAAEGRLILELA